MDRDRGLLAQVRDLLGLGGEEPWAGTEGWLAQVESREVDYRVYAA